MYNRNKPKVKKPENVVSELQAQVFYNAAMETLSAIKQIAALPKDFITATSIGIMNSNGDVQPMFPTKPKIRRSYENYVQLKRSCENIEEWEILKAEISASDLTTSQKTNLIG